MEKSAGPAEFVKVRNKHMNQQQQQLTDEAEVRGTDVLEETTLFRLIGSDWEFIASAEDVE